MTVRSSPFIHCGTLPRRRVLVAVLIIATIVNGKICCVWKRFCYCATGGIASGLTHGHATHEGCWVELSGTTALPRYRERPFVKDHSYGTSSVELLHPPIGVDGRCDRLRHFRGQRGSRRGAAGRKITWAFEVWTLQWAEGFQLFPARIVEQVWSSRSCAIGS